MDIQPTGMRSRMCLVANHTNLDKQPGFSYKYLHADNIFQYRGILYKNGHLKMVRKIYTSSYRATNCKWYMSSP